MSSKPGLRVALPTWIGLSALLVLVWFVYRPGLSGGFVFDDFVNLNALGATGRVDDWPTLLRYLTSGAADPTGRPIALLSFLLDARDWPADALPFLRTNVLLHLANTALLFALLAQLGRWLGRTSLVTTASAAVPSADALGVATGARHHDQQGHGVWRLAAFEGTAARNHAAALLGAGLWALHPLLVSTTLYIVQREAMLAATFTLLGLLAWGHGRQQIGRSSGPGARWMIGGILLGTVLATLCKANGALLPLLAWVLDATVYRDGRSAPLVKRLRWLLLVLPGVLICAYVLSRLGQWSELAPSRAWTFGQRVLTEPRVLLDYLRLLVVPRVLSTGVYNDAYAWSTGPLHPWTTLPALLAVVALLASGFILRRRFPVAAAALLFFFAGQLLESTTIPLELYFEHRNYLPAMLLGWPVARVVVDWKVPVALRSTAAALLLGLLATTCWQRASLWSDQPRMAVLWAATNPASSRAIATQALFAIDGHRPDIAMAILAAPWQRRPNDLQLALNYVDAACLAGGPTPHAIGKVEAALRNASEGDQLIYRWLGDVLPTAQTGTCPGVTLATVETWTRAALANPHFNQTPGRQQDLHAILGRLALARGDAAGALQEFRLALDASPTPNSAAQQAAWLAAAGHPSEGLSLLDHYEAVEPRYAKPGGWNMSHLHQWVLARQDYWPHEFAELRRKMREDLAARGKAG